MEIINVTDEIIEINVTEAVVNIVTQTGAYPLPSNVFSVFGRTGNVVGQAGDYTTSLVTEGTNLYYTDARSRAAISENITGLEYSSASGIFSLANGYLIPTQAMLDAKVPYTGATGNVTLGEYQLTAGQVAFDQTPTGTAGVGVLRWNNTDGTLDLGLKGGNVTLQIGQEQVKRVVNGAGINLTEAAYQVVRVSGAQGQRLQVVLAQANNDQNSATTLGIVTENINNNQEGFITTSGEVRDINTTGSLQGETWADGDVLYLSPTTAGRITNIKPVAPNHMVIVGYVEYAHQNNGKIFVKVDNGYELDELHNVKITDPLNNQALIFDSTDSVWKNESIASAIGYTPANAATLISTTAPLTGGGDLSANRTLSMPAATTSANGYLTSTDWNTFNNKENFLASGTTAQYYRGDKTFQTLNTTAVAEGTNLYYTDARARAAITGTAPISVTSGVVSISQAGSAANGFLSSTDWNTFNNKQAAGNYITALTGEATASGPGSASVTLTNSAVTGKVLTGLNITGGSVSATDSLLSAFGKVQNQINGLIGGAIFQSVWNASTNTPTLTSSVGTKGYYYIVDVSGTTNLNGITDWRVGDWAIYDGTAWQKVDNTDAVSSVNGFTGAVSLTTANISEATNLYYTDARARAAITLTTTGTSGAATYSGGTLNIPQYQGVLTNPVTGTGTTNTLPKFTGTSAIGNSNITDNGSLITLGSITRLIGASTFSTDTAIDTGDAIMISSAGATAASGAFGSGLAFSGVGISSRRAAIVPVMSNTSADTDRLGLAFFTHPSATGTDPMVEMMRLDSNGGLSIGSTGFAGYNLYLGKDLSGAVTSVGVAQQGIVASTTINEARSFDSLARTAAASFTLGIYTHFRTQQATLGAGSSITNQYGFWADSSLTGATNNFGFYGNIPSGTNRWNLYMNGTAANYMAGQLSIGTTSLTEFVNIANSTNGVTRVLTTNTNAGTATQVQYQLGNGTHNASLGLTGSSFTASGVFLQGGTYLTSGNSAGGLLLNTGAAQPIYFGINNAEVARFGTNGALGIGSTSLTQFNLRVSKTITGNVTSYAQINDGIIQSDVTTGVYYRSTAATAAATFTTDVQHFNASQGTFGVGSTVTNQYGYLAANTLIGATNNYGFFGSIPSGTNRWNLYMAGTAANYMAGSLGIGQTDVTTDNPKLAIGGNIGGSSNTFAIKLLPIIQSNVTSVYQSFRSNPSTQAASFTLSSLIHYTCVDTPKGAGSTITNQYGYFVDAFTSGTNNYGFYGTLASGTNRWNLYMAGTAQNYLAGRLGIGTTSIDTNVQLHLLNSTNGFVGLRLEGSATYAGSDWTIYASSLSPSSADDFLGFFNNSTTDGATAEYKFRLFKSGAATFSSNVTAGGNLVVQNGNVLSVFRSDNARAIQLFTDNDACYVDSWAATSEPLRLRSNGSSGRIEFYTAGGEKMRITSGSEVVRGPIREFAQALSPADPYTGDARLNITHTPWGGNNDSGSVYVEFQARAYGNNQTTLAYGIITYRLGDNGINVTNVVTSGVTTSNVTISTDVSSNYILRIRFEVAQNTDRISLFARTTNGVVSSMTADIV